MTTRLIIVNDGSRAVSIADQTILPGRTASIWVHGSFSLSGQEAPGPSGSGHVEPVTEPVLPSAPADALPLDPPTPADGTPPAESHQ